MIPVNTPQVTEQDIAKVVAELRHARLSGTTDTIAQLERRLAEYVGTRAAVAVSSGSAALDLAFELANIGPGDEVILPTFTIVSCLAPILRRGAIPVFVDSSSNDWNMDLGQTVASIGPRTRAIVVVHTYGLGVDIAQLRKLMGDSQILVIEDAAESLGVRVNGSPCGSLGDVATHSFYANKVVTGGEGGALTLNDTEGAERLRSLRNLAFGHNERFRHEEAAWNFRLSSLQAALVTSQLDRISKLLEHRSEVGLRYRARLAALPGIEFHPTSNAVSTSGHWVVALCASEASNVTSREMAEDLARRGVETRPLFAPLHDQPLLAKYELPKFHGLEFRKKLPIAESLYRRGIYLPTGNGITLNDVDLVCEAFEAMHRRLFA